MTLETCKRGWHPLRRFDERRTSPQGPQGTVLTNVHATCRFCDHSDFLFTLLANTEGEGRHRRKAYSHHDMRSALAKLRKSRRQFLRDAKLKAKGSIQC
jgi:hypothetical protein